MRNEKGQFVKGNEGYWLGKKRPPFSEEARRNMSEGQKGKKVHNRKPLSEKAKKHLSLFWKGRKKSKSHTENIRKAKLGSKNPMFGVSPSEETLKKRSAALKGKERSVAVRLAQSKRVPKGADCHFWRGGVSPENKKIRHSIELRLWREAVFARDNWTCQKTGERGGRLHPHHIQNFADYPELRFVVDNGITLSELAHREFHKKYGIKNNTKEQLEEFLAEVKNGA